MPTWEGAILRENRQTIVKYKDQPSAVICASMAEPIKVPLGFWARIGPKHHVLLGCPDPRGKGKSGG